MSGRRASPVPAGVGGRLAAILRAGEFTVTGEVVPPRGADAEQITAHGRALVGSIDAANVTDNPAAKAHMSAVAGAALVARAGIEPTLQITCRDRNRLAITADLLGGWAMGARNVLCLTGDPMRLGDDPDATTVDDVSVLDLIAGVRRLRDEGLALNGVEISDPPRYLIGAAEVPLANPYDPARLDAKLEAGVDVIYTQIAYDVDALEAWAAAARARGVVERASVLVAVVPLRSSKGARFMAEKLPGVVVPPSIVEALEAAGDDAEAVGLDLTVDVVRRIRAIDGVSGVHLISLGRDDLVTAVVERAGLFPRPTAAT